MPKAKLPNSPRGWIAALVSSMVGFIAGLVALNWLNNLRWFK